MFRVKLKTDRTLNKYKVSLIDKEFLQVKDIDFFETFFIVVKHIMLILAFSKDWILRHMNVMAWV